MQIGSTTHLGRRTWPELDDAQATLAVPLGSMEQHGPHLPLDTDTTIAISVAATLPETVLAAAIAYGASGEHDGFAGTVSIGRSALEFLLLEFGRSAMGWAHRLIFVNGHGGNSQALVEAVRQLRFEGRDVAWIACAVEGADPHAGRAETSLMLHLAPESVRLDRAEAGNVEPLATLLPRLREHGVAALSSNGVLGDPTGASAAEGRASFEELRARSVELVQRWQPDGNGMLR